MEKAYISPNNIWNKFLTYEEKFNYFKENELISKTAKKIKKIYYNGIYTQIPKECEIVGYVDLDIAVIEIDGNLHCISTDFLKEMQPTKKEKELYNLK